MDIASGLRLVDVECTNVSIPEFVYIKREIRVIQKVLRNQESMENVTDSRTKECPNTHASANITQPKWTIHRGG